MVLYKHGIGFIERRGPVEAGSVKLTFKRAEMDDVLKSLMVRDLGGGRVTGVAYETAEDIAQVIQEKALVPPEREALLGLLRTIRGYRVALDTPAGKVEGAVVGTDETEVTRKEEIEVANPKVVVQDSAGTLHPVPVREISSLSLLDAEAGDDLRFFLDAVTSERKKHQRSITVFLEGEKHDLGVSYIAQAPSWRVSYRLDHGSEGTYVQAWGIIDNRLDEDLKDVRLTLVAGKPISFLYDIYVPRTVARPVVREEVRGVSAPVELESAPEELAMMEAQEEANVMMGAIGDMDGETAQSGVSGGAARRMSASRSRMPMSTPAGAAPPPPGPQMIDSTRVQTKMVEAGEFFRYDIETPVTIPRGQSAMVPILAKKVGARKDHVYNPAKMPLNPVVSLRLKNDSGAVLERGPAVVLDDGTYAGEGILPYTSLEGEAQVAYAVDLGVQVKQEEEHAQTLVGISIERYYLRRSLRNRRTTKYSVDNRKTEPIELVDTAKPAEELPGLRRFRMSVKPKSHLDFVAHDEHLDYAYEEVRSISAETLAAYVKGGHLKEPEAARVKALWDLYRNKESFEKDLARISAQRTVMQAEQARLRENLKALGEGRQESALRATYISKLDTQEKTFEALEAKEREIALAIKKTDEEIAAALEKLAEPRK